MLRGGLVLLLGAMIGFSPALLPAQDGLNSEQLKRMYDDAVVQLKNAQDRRNELAHENEKIRGRVAELEKQTTELQASLNKLADKTFQARSERAAFAEFLRENPPIQVQWQLFLEKTLPGNSIPGDVLDRQWPFNGH